MSRRRSIIAYAGNPLPRFAPAVLGLVIGLATIWTSSCRGRQWQIWALLAIGLTISAGAVFSYGLDRWADLAALISISVRDVAALVGTLGSLSLLALLGWEILTPGSSWRGTVLCAIAIVGAVPAAGVMYGIRHAARDKSLALANGQQVALLITLGRLLQRLLVAVGSLVALSTLALGAAIAMQQGCFSEPDPSEAVFVLGAGGTLGVALLYAPAFTALRDKGVHLCDELFPLDEAKEPLEILSVIENRLKVEQLLGIDRGIFLGLQSGLPILGPLLASAAAAFLP